MGILNLWILLRKIVGRKSLKKLSDENVIFMDIFAVKVDGNDVNPGIKTAKKSMKMTFSSDKIYNFSQKNPKITNI